MAGTGLRMMGGVHGKQIPLDELEVFFPSLFGSSSRQNAEGVYQVVPWLYRAANLRAHSLSGIKYKLHKKGSDTQGSDNPFDETDMLWLLWRSQLARCIWGASFWLKRIRSRELQWLNPRTMRVEDEGNRFIQNYEGQERVYTKDQIVYMPLFHPTNDVGPGVAPAQVALTEALLSYNASKFGEKYFEHGAIPAVILSSERFANIPQAEIRRISDVWHRLYGGIQNAWRTAVLRFGLKPTVIGHRPRDLAMPDLKEAVKQEIAVAFGMSITYLEGVAANEATDRHETLKYYLNTVIPDATLIAETMNRQLWWPLGIEWEWLFDDLEVLQQYEAEKASGLARIMSQILRVADGGILTRDRAVYVVEHLLKQMSLEIPDSLPDEEPEPEPEPEPPAVPVPPQQAPPAEAQGGNAPAVPTKAETQQQVGECIEDLRLWRKVVKRHGSDRAFVSDSIPDALQNKIRERIEGQSTENALAFFDLLLEGKLVPLFFPKVGEEPFEQVPASIEISEEELEEAIQRWDQLFPQFAGMLEATTSGSMDVGSAP